MKGSTKRRRDDRPMPRASPALEIRFPPLPFDTDLQDRLLAALDDHGPVAIDEGTCAPDLEDTPPTAWLVHFPDSATRDRAAVVLERAFASSGVTLGALDVADEDWAQRAQAVLRHVRIGSLVVAPPWDVPAGWPGVVVIQPSMGFGTGHHATTRLCLRALQRLDLAGRTVLDLGTGSSVLAIAAIRLGAARAAGVDCDPDALGAARENLGLNGVEDRVTLHRADLAALRAAPLAPADVVLANLTAAVLQRDPDIVRACAVPKGSLVLSGMLREQTPAVKAAFEADGVKRVTREDVEEEWVALTLSNV